jgi:mannose-6-phosphate isomerase
MQTHQLYPLRFKPVFRRYLWGGRRLGTLLNKPIGEGTDYAESWELVDRGRDQSIVASGPLAGFSLQELMQQHGEDLLGRHHPQPRFPLLFKLLDATRQLSVQVHPNDAQAQLLASPDLGKTEAWVILAADEGSYIYAGLRKGFDRHAFERELRRGTCELCLHKLEPQPGDCIFLPAGTVHALGPGLLVAEIQQSSDTTYRVFDWNRVGADGKTRPLHIEQALEVIDFDAGPVIQQVPLATPLTHVERLVNCEKFVLDRWRLGKPHALEDDQRCHILCVVEGSVSVSGDPAGTTFNRGEVILIPAASRPVIVEPAEDSIVLDAYLP